MVALSNASISVIYVSSTVLLIESYPVWIVDSGAIDHVTRDREPFIVFLRVPSCTRWIYVLYAPEIRRNLISVFVLLGLGFSLNFSRDVVSIYYISVYYGCGRLRDAFIVLDCVRQMFNYYVDRCVSLNFCSSSNEYIDDYLWHARLGHSGQDRMNRLVRVLLCSLSKVDLPTCEHCLARKMIRKPVRKAIRAEFPLQVIHSDICVQMSMKASHGASYFIIFIDDFTRFGHLFLISHKSDALECFKRYMNGVENQMDRTMKTLRTDRGCEYLSDQFKDLCNEKGII